MTSQPELPGRFLNRAGMTLTYRVEGNGPIVVCHPGGPGFSSAYLEDLGGLSRTRTLVLLDPRGTGASERPQDSRAYTLDHYVDDLEDLRRHLGLDTMDLLGQSHGGVVAIDYASRNAARVSRLLLVTTLAHFSGAPKEAMEAAMARRAGEPWYADAVATTEQEQAGQFNTDEEMGALWDREVFLYFAKVGELEQKYIESHRGESVNADALRLFNTEVWETFDLRPGLPKITSPTLVVVGDEDFITGPVAGAEIVAGIPGAEMVTIADAGHFVFIEKRDEFRAALERFLEEA